MEDLSPIRGRPSIWDVKIWVSKSEVVRFNGWFCPDKTDLDDRFGGFIVKKRVVIEDGNPSYEQYAKFLLSCGSAIEVLEPRELRNTMRELVHYIYGLYKCDQLAPVEPFTREPASERDADFDASILGDEDPKWTFNEWALERRGDTAVVPEDPRGVVWAFRKADLFELCKEGTVKRDHYDNAGYFDAALRYEGVIPGFANEFFFLRQYNDFILESPKDIVEKIQRIILELKSFYSSE